MRRIRTPIFAPLLLLVIWTTVAPAIEIDFPIPDHTLRSDIFGNPQSLFPDTDTYITDNVVDVNSGSVPNSVYGAIATTTNTVSGNQVTIRGGVLGAGPFAIGFSPAARIGIDATTTVGGTVYGGLSWLGGAVGNTVTVTDGQIDGHIRGGATLSGSGTVSGNRVIVSGGSVTGEIDGGLSIAGDSVGNSVILSGGQFGGTIWGGSSLGGGSAANNRVTITGGVFQGNIFGAYALTGSITDCQVSFTGVADATSFPSSTIEVYGAYSPGDAIISGNRVAITDSPGVRSGGLIGGYTYTGLSADDNHVAVANSPGLVATRMVGGHSTATGASATGNSVAIANSAGFQVAVDITGGSAGDNGGTATGNSVSIIDSANFRAGDINGGYAFSNLSSPSDSVSDNSVLLADSANAVVTGVIVGGRANQSDATDNTVSIIRMRGLSAGDIIGGSTLLGNAASGNRVTIADSASLNAGNIFGGYSPSGTDATNNTVTFDAAPNFTTGIIAGGYAAGGDFVTGNTLNMNLSGGTAAGVLNFQKYSFFLPNTLGNGQTLIAITGATPTEMGNTTLTMTGIEGGGSFLIPGNSVVLIGQAQGTPAVTNATQVPKGIGLLYDFTVSTSDGSLRATLARAQKNPDFDILPHGPLAELAVINMYSELIEGLAAARVLDPTERRRGPDVYARVLGGGYRCDSGSSIDVDGVSLLAGMDWRIGDKLVLGGFLEAGHGNFHSRHKYANLPERKGSGRINYYGGGALAFFNLTRNLYVEASIRAGSVDSSLHAKDLHYVKRSIDYDLSHAYYGAHAGIGYLWRPTDRIGLDMYSKYLWVRQAADSVNVLGNTVKFDAADSQRWRTGVRLSWAATRRWSLFTGAAFEYEFDGKVDANAHAHAFTTSSLKGGSGLGELGAAYTTDKGVSVELVARGYTGKREGVVGRFLIGKSF